METPIVVAGAGSADTGEEKTVVTDHDRTPGRPKERRGDLSPPLLKLLVVISGRPDRKELCAQLHEWVTTGMELRLVASPSVSALEWLTNDEDASRNEAEELASLAINLMPWQVELESEVGSSNTLEAIEDALRTFRADQVLIVLAGEASGPTLELTRLLTERGLPVRTLRIASRPD
ncbi:MAG TPA: hypothetical protein VFA66_03945 [Gaiellaceae bacterium]|nr:hypothetical protein [Gaiellaceae bacterium]